MNLPNTIFKDFPIDFKQINSEDFPDFNVEKIRIEPDRGYISSPLDSVVSIEEKNTVVINAPVGQGKTTAIINFVQKYYQEQEYLIFIASPYVSLVQQYYDEVRGIGIPETDIFRYEMLGNEGVTDYISKRVHIVTVNCILGNPGEDAFINSEVKRTYLKRLSEYSIRRDKKVVFIYDEIHDAIHNFKERYIFNLWKWKDTIHKNFIVSATYNEASKVVIEYLAELTNNKIQIIESSRTERNEEKLSDLYLHFNPAYFYKYDNEDIVRVFHDLIKRNKEIDVLCYSKSLAESIIENKEKGIGAELYKKYKEINNCTSELITNQRTDRIEPQNRYDNNKCNVGTNFVSGVSIRKTNHAYVIIMPPRGAKMPFQNLYGVFTRGVNSLIQSLARQRNKGEIHIILPRPDEFDYTSLPFEGEPKDIFESFYDKIKHHKTPKELVKYHSFESQNATLSDFYYNVLRANVEKEIDIVEASDRTGKIKLEFPDFRNFILNEGEDYLSNQIPFWGGDLSSFIVYSAITNQFNNCDLKGVSIKPLLVFTEGFFQKCFDAYYQMYFGDDFHYSKYIFLNDSLFYKEFREDIYTCYEIRVNINNKWHKVKRGGTNSATKIFENQLLSFVQRLQYPHLPYNTETFYNEEGELIDGIYNRSQYLMHAISHSRYVDERNLIVSDSHKNRIKAFKFLDLLRKRVRRLILKSSSKNGGDFRYLNNKPKEEFIKNSEIQMFNDMIDYFIEDDFCLNTVYSFNERLKNKTIKKQIETIYRVIVEDFFKTEDIKLSTGKRANVKKVISMYKIPYYGHVIDLMSPGDYKFTPQFLDKITLSSEELQKIFSQ